MIDITIPLGPGNDLTNTLERLYGNDARDFIWGNPPKTNTQPPPDDNAQGDNVIPGPTNVPGVFTQDWLNAHWQDFLLWAIVLVCIMLGIGLAVRH